MSLGSLPYTLLYWLKVGSYGTLSPPGYGTLDPPKKHSPNQKGLRNIRAPPVWYIFPPKTKNFRRIFVKLWPAVYPSRMAPFGLKLWENTFQAIPDISFLDAGNIKTIVFLQIFERLFTPREILHDPVRPQTLGKHVSDDPRHFIFRRRTTFLDAFFG